MAFKITVLFALGLIELISSQAVCNNLNGGLLNSGLARFNGLNGLNGLNNGLNGLNNGLNGGGVASTGGGFQVSSASPTAPTGVSVVSENAYEGPLNVGGNLPFLGSVAVDGVLPTSGAGAVSYGCGNGAVGITEEGPIATGITGPTAYAGPAGGVGSVGVGGLGVGGLGYGRRFGLGCA